MSIKLFDSELKVMEILWREGDLSAGEIAKILKNETGWNRNTTYTVIKKCIEKGAIERFEPHYMCHAMVTKSYVQQAESSELINKMFDGSIENFFAAFVKGNQLSSGEIERLRQMVEEMGGK